MAVCTQHVLNQSMSMLAALYPLHATRPELKHVVALTRACACACRIKFVAVYNHISFMDGPLLAALYPFAFVINAGHGVHLTLNPNPKP